MSGGGISIQLDIGAFVIGGISLLVSSYAVYVAKTGQARVARRDEFQPFRIRLENGLVGLSAIASDLSRLTEETVPMEAFSQGFDRHYGQVDAALRELEAGLLGAQETGLFQDTWTELLDESADTWATEYDCAMNERRSFDERRAAGIRAVAALGSIENAIRERIRRQVRLHAS